MPAKQAHKTSFIYCERTFRCYLHPEIVSRSRTTLVCSFLLMWQTGVVQDLFSSAMFAHRHIHTRLCCWMSHPPCESDSGAHRRRQARQPTVCRLLPQIEATSYPERWAVMCFIWRQAINSLPAQRGKHCAPYTPPYIHLAGKYFTSQAPVLKIRSRVGWCLMVYKHWTARPVYLTMLKEVFT